LFFACAKKSNQKKAHPAFAPFGFATPTGFSDAASVPRQKTTHIHVRRPCGVLPVVSAAAAGAPVSQRQQQKQNHEQQQQQQQQPLLYP
jgi:hypothetical protein